MIEKLVAEFERTKAFAKETNDPRMEQLVELVATFANISWLPDAMDMHSAAMSVVDFVEKLPGNDERSAYFYWCQNKICDALEGLAKTIESCDAFRLYIARAEVLGTMHMCVLAYR